MSRFITKVLSSEFDGTQALEVLQRRCTMNYGSTNTGSYPARKENRYALSYHLDFISIIGRPLRPITKKSGRLFDNVTISLQNWQAPYSAKHAKGAPADLRNRTFRLAEGATREEWYIVMHPARTATVATEQCGRERDKGQKGTALARCHAQALAGYIKSVFLEGELVGEGVEGSWGLGGKERQTMAFNRWVRFQELFMAGWSAFTQQHRYDRFWAENHPAFHAYDYGANIEIEVTEQLESLEREIPLRPACDEDDEDEGDSGSESSSEERGERHATGGLAGREEREASSTPEAADDTNVAETAAWVAAGEEAASPFGPVSCVPAAPRDGNEISVPDCTGHSVFDLEDWTNLSEDDPFTVDSVAGARVAPASAESHETQDAGDAQDTHDGLYCEGLKQLREELEAKYRLENVDTISYALAVNVNCMAPSAGEASSARSAPASAFNSSRPSPPSTSSQRGEASESLCLLADRNRVSREYRGRGDFTFYPLGFHPAYGNVSSPEPPRFLATDQLAIMKDNMSFQNDGADVLEFGYFQAYSNIKRSIRHSRKDLLASRGSATAALSIPASDASSRAHVRKTQQKLLERLRGQLTPDNPDASTPFARERQRIEAAIAAQEYAFRFEQVVSISVKRLVPERRGFATVLYPIFQLIRFFLREKKAYLGMLRQFPPVAFPGVLAGFARVFELALKEMEERFRMDGSQGLGLALSEGVAALDRLGNFCFTGDPTVLPPRVLTPLKTMESLRRGGWPYICLEMLDLREGQGFIHLSRWPRQKERPLLMHVASLAYHYGPQVAANRQSQLWFAELGGRAMRGLSGTSQFVEEIFRELWTDDTRSFVGFQLLQRLNRGVRGGQTSITANQATLAEARDALSRWETCVEPFSWRSAAL